MRNLIHVTSVKIIESVLFYFFVRVFYPNLVVNKLQRNNRRYTILCIGTIYAIAISAEIQSIVYATIKG